MSYSTTWYHLDKDNKVLKEYKNRVCFSSIIYNENFEKDLQYLEYDFSNLVVSEKEAKDYFLFLKSIPEFKELMPKSCTQMAKTMRYKVDLHKFNGTKIFTILTLIRAVVEEPSIVREVISFDRKFKYSLSRFGILKMCGSFHVENNNHWITNTVDKSNLNKVFNRRVYWEDHIPCIKTGLGRNIHNTFNHTGDGFAVKQYIDKKYIDSIKAEKDKPIKKGYNQKMYDSAYLQLGF